MKQTSTVVVVEPSEGSDSASVTPESQSQPQEPARNDGSYRKSPQGGVSRKSSRLSVQPPSNEDSQSISPAEQEDDQTSGDLQFKKKDFHKSRTQSFQSVLSTASLKSLKQQFTAPNQPQLQRNPSTISQVNLKNFQSFIQAPVLSSVSNLRTDDIEIGQRLPFDKNHQCCSEYSEQNPSHANHSLESISGPSELSTNRTFENAVEYDEDDEDDIYKEETTLQQQRLTSNALKKLSLSLAPIIRSDEDDNSETQPRQLTTKSLNTSRRESKLDQKDPKINESRPASAKASTSKKAKPYKPAEVDLSSFSSLTRQSKHLTDTTSPEEAAPQKSPLPTTVKQPMPSTQRLRNGSVSAPTVESFGMKPAEKATKPAESDKQHKPKDTLEDQTSNRKSSAQPARQSNMNPHPRLSEKSMQIPTSTINGDFHNLPEKPTTSTLAKPDRRLQQINGLRSPMYIPAVLRKTVDENLEYSETDHDEQPVAQVSSNELQPGSSGTSVRSEESTYSNESKNQKLGPYTLNQKEYEYIQRAAPTRKHWLKDETVVQCGIVGCKKRFSFFERRHHCRKCGGIFCKEHTSHYLYINHLAQFTTGGRGTLSRVCDRCIQGYNDFIRHEFGVNCDKNTHRAPVSKKVDYRKEIFATKMKSMNMNSPTGEEDGKPDQLVGSVPANWSWSSF